MIKKNILLYLFVFAICSAVAAGPVLSIQVSLDQGMNRVVVPLDTLGEINTPLSDLFTLSEFIDGTSRLDVDAVCVFTGAGYAPCFLYADPGPNFNETAWVNTSYNSVNIDLIRGQKFRRRAQSTFTGSATKPY